MNEGFFSYEETKTFAKKVTLPPIIKMELPPTKGAKLEDSVEFCADDKQLFMDIECYWNYFLVKFLNPVTDNYICYEMTKYHSLAIDSLLRLIKSHEIITFNGNKFDIPILKLALQGASTEEIKKAANKLIQMDMSVHTFEEVYNLPELKIKHIDLIEIPIGIVSLKIYGGRLHCRKMQDLPYDEDMELSEDQMDDVEEYCGNDLDITKLIFCNLFQQVELRRLMSKKYKQDLLSKSDAQIAEAVIKAEVMKIRPGKIISPEFKTQSFHYDVPDYIQFNHPHLKKALEIVSTKKFVVDNSGKVKMPKELDELKVVIGSSTYRMGVGGLHSSEKGAFHISDDKFSLFDWDVDSYYPSIILNLGLYPKQLGKKEFLSVYGDIVRERLNAKHSGDKVKASTLKIVINGSFGKFGSPYSILYAPELLVQVTVTGQLALLMLIDMMEHKGIPVVSGNTDGIVVKCPVGKEEMMNIIIRRWQKITGFNMSKSQYAGLYSRDVNAYIAVKTDGEVKRKGIFAAPSIAKNPENEVCSLAVIEYVTKGIPYEETIRNCTDITKFLTVRSVKGGAVKDKQYLGKAIRFYHAKGVGGYIEYKSNGHMVPNSEGTKPLMILDGTFPKDVDYDWYVNKTKEIFG
jgi:DNA polymerase elongation subunit (family B)